MLSGTRTLEGPVASILQFVRVDSLFSMYFVTSVMSEAFDAACAELQDGNLSQLVAR